MFGFNWKTFERSGESFSSAGDGAPPRHARKRRPRIGLALGSGAARGWSHIGVLQELEARGVPIDVIAGASIGAVVGGCFAAGRLSSYKVPRRVIFLAESDLSLTGSNKVKTAALRELVTGLLVNEQSARESPAGTTER